MNERRGISKFDLKQHNCSQILRVIRESEQTSRTDIADEIHLTQSSVTMLVNEMIKEGVLLEKDSFYPERTDEATRTSCRYDRGRRKLCLSINDTYRFAAGVCIEHNRLTVGITTLSLQLLESQSVAFSLTESVEATVKKIVKLLEKILTNNCLSYANLLGICVGLMPEVQSNTAEAKSGFNGEQIRNLKKKLEEQLDMTVFCWDALRFLAIAGVPVGDDNGSSRRQLILWQREKETLEMMCGWDDCVHSLNAFQLSQNAEGTVAEELTIHGLRTKVVSAFLEKGTPKFQKVMSETLSDFKPFQLVIGAKTDTRLRTLADDYLNALVLLLYNLNVLFQPQDILLFRMGTEEILQEIRDCAKQLYEESFSNSIDNIAETPSNLLLGSCHYLIESTVFSGIGFISSEKSEKKL